MLHEKKAEELENQIINFRKLVDYITLEYPIEVIVQKYLVGLDDDENEMFVPQYQRDFVWSEDRQSKFIESLFLGLPIPFLFVADVDGDNDGRVEIVDGSQRIRALANYVTDGLELSELEKLTKLNGLRFSDLPPPRQKRFLRTNIKMIQLTDKADEEARKDIFERINTGSDNLRAMEVRTGSMSGPFYALIKECSEKPLFRKLAPVSVRLAKRQENQELVLRFFAYLDDADLFEHRVDKFLNQYLKKMNAGFDKAAYEERFDSMLRFIDRNLPYGFKKSPKAKSTPRVRFETLAVGAAEALKVNPHLVVHNLDWLESKEFKEHTRSDGSNSRVKLKNRIEYVKEQLLRNS